MIGPPGCTVIIPCGVVNITQCYLGLGRRHGEAFVPWPCALPRRKKIPSFLALGDVVWAFPQTKLRLDTGYHSQRAQGGLSQMSQLIMPDNNGSENPVLGYSDIDKENRA